MSSARRPDWKKASVSSEWNHVQEIARGERLSFQLFELPRTDREAIGTFLGLARAERAARKRSRARARGAQRRTRDFSWSRFRDNSRVCKTPPGTPPIFFGMLLQTLF